MTLSQKTGHTPPAALRVIAKKIALFPAHMNLFAVWPRCRLIDDFSEFIEHRFK